MSGGTSRIKCQYKYEYRYHQDKEESTNGRLASIGLRVIASYRSDRKFTKEILQVLAHKLLLQILHPLSLHRATPCANSELKHSYHRKIMIPHHVRYVDADAVRQDKR
jgi:hypothetical protein